MIRCGTRQLWWQLRARYHTTTTVHRVAAEEEKESVGIKPKRLPQTLRCLGQRVAQLGSKLTLKSF